MAGDLTGLARKGRSPGCSPEQRCLDAQSRAAMCGFSSGEVPAQTSPSTSPWVSRVSSSGSQDRGSEWTHLGRSAGVRGQGRCCRHGGTVLRPAVEPRHVQHRCPRPCVCPTLSQGLSLLHTVLSGGCRWIPDTGHLGRLKLLFAF